jgi:hypothetical protein
MENDYKFNIEKPSIYKVKIIDDKTVAAIKCPDTTNCAFKQDRSAVMGTWNILFE